jgi:hypothetical protein
VLFSDTYKEGIAKVLKMDNPLRSSLRSQLSDVENMDSLHRFSRTFQMLAVDIQTIWGF